MVGSLMYGIRILERINTCDKTATNFPRSLIVPGQGIPCARRHRYDLTTIYSGC